MSEPTKPIQQPLSTAPTPAPAKSATVAEPPAILSQLEKAKTNIATFLKARTAAIEEGMVGGLQSKRLIDLMVTEVQKNPQLANCSMESFFDAAKRMAQAGLEPGPFGHAYLVPFNNKDKGTAEVQFIPGWRGLCHVAYRSKSAKLIKPTLVFECDTIEKWEDEVSDHFRLIPNDNGKRDESTCRGVVCWVTLPDGTRSPFFMSKADILRRKAISKAATGDLWTKWWDEAYKKTAVRNATKYLDLSHLPPASREVEARAYEACDDGEMMNDADVVSVSDAAPKPTTTAEKALARVAEIHPEVKNTEG